jgi:hypothetical protein
VVDEKVGTTVTSELEGPNFMLALAFDEGEKTVVLVEFKYRGEALEGMPRRVTVGETVFESAFSAETIYVVVGATCVGGLLVGLLYAYLKRDADDLDIMTKTKEINVNYIGIGMNTADPLTDFMNWSVARARHPPLTCFTGGASHPDNPPLYPLPPHRARHHNRAASSVGHVRRVYGRGVSPRQPPPFTRFRHIELTRARSPQVPGGQVLPQRHQHHLPLPRRDVRVRGTFHV